MAIELSGIVTAGDLGGRQRARDGLVVDYGMPGRFKRHGRKPGASVRQSRRELCHPDLDWSNQQPMRRPFEGS
jgi:hypothetical protein